MSETAELLKKIKEQKPLIHHITNWVTIYDCANIVRAIGALPVMAHAKEEAADMAKIASAVVLNIGTLTNELIESMKLAGKAANEKGIPIILDAVGVGATKLRDEKALELLKELKINIIKGNASEIAKLAGEKAQTKGVEATKIEADLIEIAKRLANDKKATVVLTGAEDIITNGADIYICKNGHDMMGKFVGTGCMAASVIASFAAIEKDYAKAAASALVVFGITGELASRRASGPGSYKEAFYDEIFNLDETDIHDMEKLEKKTTTKKEEPKIEEEKPEEKQEEEKPKKKKKEKPKTEKKKEEPKEEIKEPEEKEPKVEKKEPEEEAPKPEEKPKEEPKVEEKESEEKKEETTEEKPEVEEKPSEKKPEEEPKEEPKTEEKEDEKSQSN